MSKTQRKNKRTPAQAVDAAWPKRKSTLTAPRLFAKVYGRVLTDSGLGAAFKKQGRLYAADDRWLGHAYAIAFQRAHGRAMTESERGW